MISPIPEVTELHEVELIPVIELEPSEFKKSSRESPDGTIKEFASEWDQYWRASLNDAGVPSISPISLGSWHVATKDLTVQKLDIILRVLLDDSDGLDYLNDAELTPVLSGGFALESKLEGVVIEPRCCCDLGVLKDWKVAAKVQEGNWEQLWIGHPWLSVKRLGSNLLLSEPHESTEPVARWRLNPKGLEVAIEKAEVELKRFSNDIATVLNNWGIQGNVVQIASRLAGE